MDLIFSSFSRSQNHSYKNSIVFRLVLKHITSWRASEASKTVLGVDNAKSGICYWRASVAIETLTGVTQLKIGDVCLLVSERSERDTIRGNSIEISLLFIGERDTYRANTIQKIRDVYLLASERSERDSITGG